MHTYKPHYVHVNQAFPFLHTTQTEMFIFQPSLGILSFWVSTGKKSLIWRHVSKSEWCVFIFLFHRLLNWRINPTVNDHVGLYRYSEHSWTVNLFTSLLFNVDCTTSALHHNTVQLEEVVKGNYVGVHVIRLACTITSLVWHWNFGHNHQNNLKAEFWLVTYLTLQKSDSDHLKYNANLQ